MSRVGIMGGTFDPIHYGHLAMAEGVSHALGLDQVLFLPNRQPPHKEGRPISPTEHRTAMVRLAIAGNPRFALSTIELDRSGPSYMIDTVRQMQQLEPQRELVLMIGMDSLLEIKTWRDYQHLLAEVDVAVVNRPGYAPHERDALSAELGPALTRRIRWVELPGVAVSSTLLRAMSAQGRPLRYLVPDTVLNYIQANALYQGGGLQ